MLSEDLSEVLGDFARTMLTDFAIQEILDRLVGRIVGILPVTGAGVTLIAPGMRPQYIAASHDSAMRYERLQTELGEGPCLVAYDSGEAIAVPDLRREARFPDFSAHALRSGLMAVFTFPLRHDDLSLGALDLYRETTGPLSARHLRAAQTLADVAAAYLINAQARSDLEDAAAQSRIAALHDPLTGLPNRALMLERLEHAFQRAQRSHTTAALFFIDLDRFKQVNDSYGHQVGDELLIAVAQRLTEIMRPGDTLARLAGDEFVILCEDLNEPSQFDALALRFETALAPPFRLSRIEVQMAASVGIAASGPHCDTPEDLLHTADLAMYRNKRHRDLGRTDLDRHALHLADSHPGLARSLPGALERDEFHVAYQPIVNAADGRITAVEALLRWTHPSRGPVSPTVLIPFAEQSGQIVELGQWVLEHACTALQQQRRADMPIGISVNVSACQIMAPGFVATVADMLESTSTDPGLLTLEVTESVFIRDEQRALVILDALKQIGVTLALDDFGTGYSSLSYLNTLPIDTIKIDQTFIATLSHDPDSQRIVTSIIALAHSLAMTVVAEGVETPKQHRALIKLGSDSCQGFYFARPMPADQLDAFIRQQNGSIVG